MVLGLRPRCARPISLPAKLSGDGGLHRAPAGRARLLYVDRMTGFEPFIGIDYSGAETPTSRLPPSGRHRPRLFVSDLVLRGTVGKSTHAAIPCLKWLRDELGEAVHFWPFDGWAPPPGKAVITEVYPSIFGNRYPRDDRSPDEQDAYATARWIADMASRGALAACIDPPLAPAERALAALEGWILRVR